MSIKKRICDHIAAAVAGAGDAKLQGEFEGATWAVRVMGGDLKEWYEKREIAIAEKYVAEREAVRDECEAMFAKLNAELVTRLAAS